MRNPDRMIAVFDRRTGSKPKISSGMTIEKLNRWEIPPTPYDDVDDLKSIVERWLSA